MRLLRKYAVVGTISVLICGCAGETPTPKPKPKPVPKSKPAVAANGKTPTAEIKRIILITNSYAPFWDACRSGVIDADKQLKLRDAGYQGVMVVNDGTVKGQIDKLRQYGSQSDVAAIGISPVNADNASLADEMRKLQKEGVKIITIDSDMNREQFRDSRAMYIGTDNYQGGVVLGICAKHLRSAGGEYVTFVGFKGAQNAVERIDGFAEGAGPGFKSADSMEDSVNGKRAVDNVRTALINHPGAKTLVGIYAYNGPAIVDVITQKKARDQYTIITFDADPRSIKQMGERMIDAMVVQDPYRIGYDGVRLLKAMLDEDTAAIDKMKSEMGVKGEGNADILDTGLKVVVPDENSPLKAEQFPKGVKFYKLAEFKEWLEKYGLEGS